MILCISKNAFKIDPKTIQKQYNFDGLLKNETRYFEDVREAYKADYIPLDFCISIRSKYTNKVVRIKFEDKNLYYFNQTNIGEYIHKGYDLIMFLSSIGIMSIVDYKAGFDDLMMKSVFSFLGVYNPNPDLVNPILYSHIIIDDGDVDTFSTYLKEGNTFEDISSIDRTGNIPVLLNSFIEVKGE